MDLLIGLAGRRGSGKTTAARKLADYGFRPTSFGDIVRREAAMLAVPTTTPDLQRLGNDLITTWGWQRLCTEVIQTVRDAPRIVIDGFRHTPPVLYFREQFGERFKLVFLNIDEDTRVARLLAREGFDPHCDQHPVELQVDELRGHADAIVTSGDNAALDILSALALNPTRLHN